MTRLASSLLFGKDQNFLHFSKSLLCNLGPGDVVPGLFCYFTSNPPLDFCRSRGHIPASCRGAFERLGTDAAQTAMKDKSGWSARHDG